MDTQLPPHTRLVGLRFDPDGRTLHARSKDATELAIEAPRVRRLHAARIHHEELGPALYNAADDEFHHAMINPAKKHVYQTVLALNADGVDEVLYIALDSFNFRESLGAEAELTGLANIPKLVEKVAAYCPEASRDAGFEAVLAHQPAPVVETLLDFLLAVRT